MALILSSSFSINMLPSDTDSAATFRPLDLEEAKELIADFDAVKNMVNPRHESTAVLSEHLCGLAAEGGFLSLDGGQEATILVMLPPREFMNREGSEIEVTDLEQVQYFEVSVSPGPSRV